MLPHRLDFRAFLVSLALAWSASEQTSVFSGEQKKSPTPVAKIGADNFGDPLPEGAVARMGTIRLRPTFGARELAFSPDGQLLASSNDDHIWLWETATGKLVRRLNHEHQVATPLSFPPMAKLYSGL